MKVKALCNIIYKGNFYTHGEVFEAEKTLKNAVIVPETKQIPKPEAAAKSKTAEPDTLKTKKGR